MKATCLVSALLLLLLNAAVAQHPALPAATNLATANSASKYSGVSQPHNVPDAFRSNSDTQKFCPVTLKDWIGLFQGVSVIAASIVALCGINAWRREFVGKRRIELAEEVLALFYQAKDIIEFMRFPAGHADEGSMRKPESSESPDQKKTRDDAYVTFERYNRHSEVFARIFTLRWRFMVQFGKDGAAPFAGLKSILDELFVAARKWVMLSEVDERVFSSATQLGEHRARIEKCEKILWGIGIDGPVSTRLEMVIADVERLCESQIKGRRHVCSRDLPAGCNRHNLAA